MDVPEAGRVLALVVAGWPQREIDTTTADLWVAAYASSGFSFEDAAGAVARLLSRPVSEGGSRWPPSPPEVLDEAARMVKARRQAKGALAAAERLALPPGWTEPPGSGAYFRAWAEGIGRGDLQLLLRRHREHCEKGEDCAVAMVYVRALEVLDREEVVLDA